MAETKKQAGEREYVIPVRKEWLKVPRYKRTSKSITGIKEFIARHMRVPDRDTNKVRLDIYLNNEVWFRGGRKPPSKVKVKAKWDGEVVRVELAEVPEIIKFEKAKKEKRHAKTEKKKIEPKKEEKEIPEEKKDQEKKEKIEEEKEKSVEQAQIKRAEQSAKAQKHATKIKTPHAHRKALKK